MTGSCDERNFHLKLKELYRKHREVIVYLFFGVMTTAVSYGVFFGLQIFGRLVLGIATDAADPGYDGGKYYALVAVAQVLQWVAGVLFAFFTNRKWVFEATGERMLPQLMKFAVSRLATFGLDSLVTFGVIAALQAGGYSAPTVSFIITVELTADVVAKLVSAVVVIVSNYITSKLFVFKKKKGNE